MQTLLFATGKVLLTVVKGNCPEPGQHEMVDKELRRMDKRAPKTAAEKGFHQWLLEWKEANQKVVEGGPCS